MDLSDIKVVDEADKGAVFEFRKPGTGELIQAGDPKRTMHVRVVGQHSTHYVKQQRALTDRRLKRNAGKRKVTVTADQLDIEEAETLARCVLDGFVVVDGKEVANDFDSWYAFFTDERFRWVRTEIAEFIEEEENFSQKS